MKEKKGTRQKTRSPYFKTEKESGEVRSIEGGRPGLTISLVKRCDLMS